MRGKIKGLDIDLHNVHADVKRLKEELEDRREAIIGVKLRRLLSGTSDREEGSCRQK